MTLSDRVKFFLQAALGAADIRDEFITSIDNQINLIGAGGFQFIVASGGTTVLTDTTNRSIVVVGTGNHTIQLPPIDQFALGEFYTITNKSTGITNVIKAASDPSTVAGAGGVVANTPIQSFYKATVQRIIFNFSDNHIAWGSSQWPIANNSNQINAGGNKIITVADPTLTNDAATKNYVDNKILTFSSNASVGGSANEVYTVTGLLSTDTIISVDQRVKGANSLPLLGFNTLANNALTVVYSADPGANAIVNVTVKR